TSFTVAMSQSPFLIVSVLFRWCAGSVPRFSAHELLGLALLGGHSVPSFYSPAPTLTPGASPPAEEPAGLEGQERRIPQRARAQASSMSALPARRAAGWCRSPGEAAGAVQLHHPGAAGAPLPGLRVARGVPALADLVYGGMGRGLGGGGGARLPHPLACRKENPSCRGTVLAWPPTPPGRTRSAATLLGPRFDRGHDGRRGAL